MSSSIIDRRRMVMMLMLLVWVTYFTRGIPLHTLSTTLTCRDA
jgi:hypothetical protein